MKFYIYTLLFLSVYSSIVLFFILKASKSSGCGIFLNLLSMYILIVISLALYMNALARADVIDDRDHIAIIDTGANIPRQFTHYLCMDKSHLDLTGHGLQDEYNPRHGTNIAGIIAKRMNPEQECLQIIKWVHNEDDMSRGRSKKDWGFLMARALGQALHYKAHYVNMSFGGGIKIEEERIGITRLLESGATVAVAAGNESHNLDADCNYYPACYDIHSSNFHIVGNNGSGASNYGRKVTDWKNGKNIEGFGYILTGTSQSTAVFLGELIGTK